MNYFVKTDINEILNSLSDELHHLINRKVLLAGGNGFLGRYFIEIINEFNLLNKDKIILTSVDNYISSSKSNIPSKNLNKISLIDGNICDVNFVNKLGIFDIIINAAGIASPFYYRSKPLETLDVAVQGTRNLLNLARLNNCKFIFFSSSEIYGDPDPTKIPIQESYRGNVSTIGPRACYDESKRLGETLCYIFKQYFGTHTNIIRPFNIFGPGMLEEDYRVMPNFAANIISNRNLKLYGDASQTRTFCYITDAMNGFFKVICNGVAGEPYNIGTQEPEINVMELADLFLKISDSKSLKDIIEYPDSYPGDEPMRRCPDIKKAKLQLNYTPKVELEDGINRFLNWAKDNYSNKI